jgi:hypothetical protein
MYRKTAERMRFLGWAMPSGTLPSENVSTSSGIDLMVTLTVGLDAYEAS